MKYVEPFKDFFINEDKLYPKDNLNKSIKSFEVRIKNKQKNLNRHPRPLSSDFIDNYQIQDGEFDKIKRILERDCSKFINEIKSEDLLFRGMKKLPDNTYNNINGIWLKQARKNRSPIDIDTDIDNHFNIFSKEKFGIPLRKQGVFATKDPLIAKGFSDHLKTQRPYIFFPIGDYKYFWNPEITDLYNYLEDQEWYNDFESEKRLEDINFYDYHKKRAKSDGYDPMDEIKHIVQNYKQGGLSEVKTHELTFILDKYYVIHQKYYFKIKEWLP